MAWASGADQPMNAFITILIKPNTTTQKNTIHN